MNYDKKAMNNKMVSIIMPVYNVEKFVEQAILSVLNQSYDNWELIIIDDGSNDNSLSICARYAENNDKISAYHIENQGVANARNYGMRLAQGEYIAFLDSDDEFDRDFLTRMVTRITDCDSDMAVCNYRSDGINFEEATHDIEADYQIDKSEVCLKDYLDNKFYVYVIWAKLYKRTIIQDLEFKNMRIGEDTCFILDVLRKDIRVTFLDYQGYVYRSRVDGITKIRGFSDKDIDRLTIPRYFYDFVKIYYKDLEQRARDNLCYSIIRTARELAKEDKTIIRKYYKHLLDTIENVDYMNSNIGIKRKLYLRFFGINYVIANYYAEIVL